MYEFYYSPPDHRRCGLRIINDIVASYPHGFLFIGADIRIDPWYPECHRKANTYTAYFTNHNSYFRYFSFSDQRFDGDSCR